VVTAATALVLLVCLRAVSRSADRLRLRRDRRGLRRRDPVVAVLGAPWHLSSALLDTLVSLPLLAAAAALPAGLVWLLDPVGNGLERAELTVATATTVALGVGPEPAHPRRLPADPAPGPARLDPDPRSGGRRPGRADRARRGAARGGRELRAPLVAAGAAARFGRRAGARRSTVKPHRRAADGPATRDRQTGGARVGQRMRRVLAASSRPRSC
jgi:hypothetical protein